MNAGFKSQHNTANTVFLARRLLENMWADKEGHHAPLALNWANVFGITPDNSPRH
jgi:hypothetical protein